MVFSNDGQVISTAQKEFTQYYPNNGWVEHDPEEIWQTTLTTSRQALEHSLIKNNIAAMGITNQRETTVIWDKRDGRPVYNAIVWQDRRIASYCEKLKLSGHETTVTAKTGLLLDPYFSATKINWILDNVTGARKNAEAGHLAFGTIDTYLIWRLTDGKKHVTDATNASRTMLFDIHSQRWDEELLKLFNVPAVILPEVKNCADDFGITSKKVFSAKIPIAGVAGDQQAALIGQSCFQSGMVKSTYGTGCFMVMNTGDKPVQSKNKLLTTIGYRLNDRVTYALEGSIFNAGTAVQWIRDGINVIKNSDEVLSHLENTKSNNGVFLVPAFTGLGAPHWDPNARGILCGITRDTDVANLVRAAVESVCYQTHDLIDAMLDDSGLSLAEIRVDGGMVVNHWLLQFLADITKSKILKPQVTETTALGAAYLAGLQLGYFNSLEDIASKWQQQISFNPNMDDKVRDEAIRGWKKAVERCLV